MSDDGADAVVVIAMVGCPFSPRYARARGRGPADPLEHSAFNVAVSARGGSRWALTERGAAAVARDASSLAIGRSNMRWIEGGAALAIDVDERSAPWGLPVRGRIRFEPLARTEEAVAIDGAGAHLWWPIAPLGRVEVSLEEPSVRFRGTAYLDANAGTAPLEDAFARWSWSRLSDASQVAITYDVVTRSAERFEHAYRVDRDGVHRSFTGREVSLGMSRFGLRRSFRAPTNGRTRLVRTVEDGPFYARSLVDHVGERGLARGVHEVVSLDRFASSWVQFLIPFRMRHEAA